MLNIISFLSVVGLVSITTPGSASSIIQVFFQFAQLDILPTDQIYGATVEFNEVTDSAHNEYFDALGISSMNLLKNMGSTFIFLVGNFIMLAVIILSYVVSKIIPR